MAYEVAEPIDATDVDRRAQAELRWLRNIIDQLMRVQFEKRGEASFVSLASTRLLTTGVMPEAQEMRRIKDLSWKYRRQLPKGVGPTLPPHDPIVQELERYR